MKAVEKSDAKEYKKDAEAHATSAWTGTGHGRGHGHGGPAPGETGNLRDTVG